MKILHHEGRGSGQGMKLKHRISINVCEADGGKNNVIKGGEVKLREKLLRWLFGEKKKVLVIAPGDSVFNVEIREQDLGKLFDEYLDEALTTKTNEEAKPGITAEKEISIHEAVPEC